MQPCGTVMPPRGKGMLSGADRSHAIYAATACLRERGPTCAGTYLPDTGERTAARCADCQSAYHVSDGVRIWVGCRLGGVGPNECGSCNLHG